MRKSINGYRSSTSDPNTPLGRMEHLADITRLHKSLKRPPQQRTGSDIERIMAGTHQVAALHEVSESVRRDLCYVIQCVHLDKGKTFTFKDLPGAGEALFMILCGSVTVDTLSPDIFSSCLSAEAADAQKEPEVVLNDADLKELFDTLDEDKSGAIDSTEFMHALEMLGLEVSWSEMEEAVQAVDADGSGELEFPEFKIVMEEKLGFGKRGPQGWQQNKKGDKSSGSHRTYYDGDSFGDRALLKDTVLMGSISAATQDPVVAVLTKADYHHILQNGFKGDLSRKLDYLKTSPLLQQILHNTELKHLAQSCELKACPAKTELFRQGSKPKVRVDHYWLRHFAEPCWEGDRACEWTFCQFSALLFLLEGQVKILRSVHIDVDPVLANRSTHSSPRYHVTNQQMGSRRPRPPPAQSCTQKRQFQVAQLAGVDVLSEGIFAKDKRNMYTYSCSAVALTEVLVMELRTSVLNDVINPLDIDKILEHANLKKSWWLEQTEKCSAVQSSQVATHMDFSAAAQARQRLLVDEMERETASSSGTLQRTFSPPRKYFISHGDNLAQTQQGLRAPKGTMGQWIGNGTGIPVDCTETDEERYVRETAEVSFANSIRTEMTGFLHRIQPGKRVMTQELADDPMCQTGWLDVRTNAAENMVALQEGRPCTLRRPFQSSAAASTQSFASLALAKSLDATLGRTSGVVAAMEHTHVHKPRRALLEETLRFTGSREGMRQTPRETSSTRRPSSRASTPGAAHLQNRTSSQHRLGTRERTMFRTSSQGQNPSSQSLKIATASWGRVQAPKANFPQELAAGLDLALTVRPFTAGEKSAAVARAPQMPPQPSTSHTTLRPATAPELASNHFSPLLMARRGNEAWRTAPRPAAVSRTHSIPRHGRLVTAATRMLVNDMLPPPPQHANDDQKAPEASEISKRAAAILKGTAIR